MKSLTSILLLSAAVISSAAQTFTNQVIVAWDPNPEPNISEYQVYWGPTNNVAITNVSSAGLSTTNLVNLGQEWETTYWFYVTAKNEFGLESDPSTVLFHTTQVEPVKPTPPVTLPLEAWIYSGTNIFGPFTNNVAILKWRYTIPGEFFVATIKLGDTNNVELLSAPPMPDNTN